GGSAMTELLRLHHLRELIEHRNGPCVSVFLPTHRTAPANEQDPIRLKNLLRDAQERLSRMQVRSPDAIELLEPAARLLDLGLFWQYQADGLALFLAPGAFQYFRLPTDLPELVVVTDRFHVKPLLPLLTTDGRFFVLALSQNEVRLLEGSRQRVEEVELEAVPDDLADALRYDDLEKERTLHVAGRGGRSAPVVFHGHGIGDEVDRVLLERFLRQVDDGIWGVLRQERAPLVLAGVGTLRAIYEDVTRYGHVLGDGIDGNPENLRPEELHERAWALVEPIFEREREAAEASFHERQAQGGEGTAGEVPEAVVAAHDGRVASLFVPIGTQRWGTFDASSRTVVMHKDRGPGDEDLLDRAAVLTLEASGAAYAVPPERMPGAGDVAAVLRY
ncbi:MAG TPA: hypothetical protein VF129_13925, partial [Actinomycetota bacterium]